MELDLLLTVGRIDDAREWMSPSLEAELGSEHYHSLRVTLEAGTGNYEACDKELAQMAAALDRPMTSESQIKQCSYQLGQILLEAPWQKQSILHLLMNRLQTTKLFEQFKGLASQLRQQAEVETLRGALALERGDVPQAESFLRRALSLGRSVTQATSESRAAEGMLNWLKPE
jgi:hypothetical protein